MSRGARGEEYAARVLAERGYTLLERNYHSRYGEVDIIARKDDLICFVEVKTRKRNSMVTGAQAVGRTKQRKIITTALLYLQQHPELDLQPRFDVFIVVAEDDAVFSCDYLMGAFDGEAYED